MRDEKYEARASKSIIIASEAFAYKVLLAGLFILLSVRGIWYQNELTLRISDIFWLVVISGFSTIGYRVYRKDLGWPVLVFSVILLIISVTAFIVYTS